MTIGQLIFLGAGVVFVCFGSGVSYWGWRDRTDDEDWMAMVTAGASLAIMGVGLVVIGLYA